MTTTAVVVPDLGNGVQEAQIESWAKQAGDPVQAGELLLTITTPKVSLEIEAPVSGVLAEALVEEDDIVEAGERLATIDSA